MRISQIYVFTISLMILAFVFSCSPGIKGSGKVVRSERQAGEFESLSVSAGIEVILIQDSVFKMIVEADDNLQNIIKTEVSSGKLKIYPEKRISSCASRKVFVYFKTVQSIQASSGAEILSRSVLKMESLNISASSGANIDLNLTVNKLTADASSGGYLNLSGSAEVFDVDGSSGADIKAEGLPTNSCNAGSSSRANLTINVSEKIIAKASSGGYIKVTGNPKERNAEKSSGGNISFN